MQWYTGAHLNDPCKEARKQGAVRRTIKRWTPSHSSHPVCDGARRARALARARLHSTFPRRGGGPEEACAPSDIILRTSGSHCSVQCKIKHGVSRPSFKRRDLGLRLLPVWVRDFRRTVRLGSACTVRHQRGPRQWAGALESRGEDAHGPTNRDNGGTRAPMWRPRLPTL